MNKIWIILRFDDDYDEIWIRYCCSLNYDDETCLNRNFSRELCFENQILVFFMFFHDFDKLPSVQIIQ